MHAWLVARKTAIDSDCVWTLIGMAIFRAVSFRVPANIGSKDSLETTIAASPEQQLANFCDSTSSSWVLASMNYV